MADLAAYAGGERTIIAVELPHIRMTMPVDYGANPAKSVMMVRAMLDDVAAISTWKSSTADVMGHSYGTFAVAHLLKHAGECVRSATLVDPVCVGAHRSTLCKSFVYEPAVFGKNAAKRRISAKRRLIGRIKDYLIHSDPRLVGVLMRNFYWYENVLWLDADDLDRGVSSPEQHVTLFIAQQDRYVDGETIYADAQVAINAREQEPSTGAFHRLRRELRAVLWEGLDHGVFLNSVEKRRQVIESVAGVGAGVGASAARGVGAMVGAAEGVGHG